MVQTGNRYISYVLQLKNLGQENYMSRVARKCFFGVHAPDSPACVNVDTETNTSLLILVKHYIYSVLILD